MINKYSKALFPCREKRLFCLSYQVRVRIITDAKQRCFRFHDSNSHPARIQILKHLLAEKQCICGRIVELLPLAQSTVSQHLKILKESGLVQGEVEGPKTCYCVDKTKLASLATAMSILFTCEEDQ